MRAGSSTEKCRDGQESEESRVAAHAGGGLVALSPIKDEQGGLARGSRLLWWRLCKLHRH